MKYQIDPLLSSRCNYQDKRRAGVYILHIFLFPTIVTFTFSGYEIGRSDNVFNFAHA